jgi:predicted ATPase
VEALLERLDRMPLAIELFAARLRLEPLDRLRKHLDAHLDVKAARRDGPARQATLRSTIAWSWALLLPEEQEALARLTVFRGAAPIDGVEAVLGDDGLAFAASLVDKSLLRAIDAGLTFYESIRAFAAAHLAPDDRARLRHAEYFVERTRSARPGELKSHRDDLPAAFETCLAVERRDDAARLWIAWQENGQATTPLSRLVAESARVPPVVDDAVAF